MATALTSALTGRPVNRNVAMTGEITLRGRALPIGGLKEKALAAHRAGITRVLIPSANAKDLSDIPKSVRKDIEFITVEHMDEVLLHSLTWKEKNKRVKDELFTKLTKIKDEQDRSAQTVVAH
jgi:ATP-dependent Lon protease